MPAFGFTSSAEEPARTWIPSTHLRDPIEFQRFLSSSEFCTYLSNQQNLTNPKPHHSDHPTDNHDTSEPPHNPVQDYSSCFRQEELSESSSDDDRYGHGEYGYKNKGIGYCDDESSYDEDDEHDYEHHDDFEYGDDKHHCTNVEHDYTAYASPYASEFCNSSYAARMHAHISNNGISAYSTSISGIPAWNRPAATTCMPPPRFSNTSGGLGTTGSVDPSAFWSPSFPSTWGTYGTTTSVQIPHAYGVTPLAQNHYTYSATTSMQGPYAYVAPPPRSTSDLSGPSSWTQTIPVADSYHKQTVPDGMEPSQSEVYNTSTRKSSACHMEGSQVDDTEPHFPTPPAEPLPLKCHQESTTESISIASCSNEIKRDDVSGGESGAQHSGAEPACLPLQGSKDVNLSSECEPLLLSIYNMSTVFTEKINKMDNKGGLDVNVLESTIGLLTLCLVKQLPEDSTKEQSLKPGVQSVMPDNDTAPSVEALLRALSHEKHAQIVEEAVEKSLKMHLEKALKNSMDLLKLQQDILQECSKSSNALCDFKNMLVEAQNVLTHIRFQIPKFDLKLKSLARKLEDTGISDEHTSLGVSGDENGLSLDASVSSSHQHDDVSDGKHILASLSASLPPNRQSGGVSDAGHGMDFSDVSMEQQSLTSSRFQGANSSVSEPCLTSFGISSNALGFNGVLNVENAPVGDQILSDVAEGYFVKSEGQDGMLELCPSLNRSKVVLNEISNLCEGESHFPKEAEESVVAFNSDAEDWEYVASPCSGQKGEL